MEEELKMLRVPMTKLLHIEKRSDLRRHARLFDQFSPYARYEILADIQTAAWQTPEIFGGEFVTIVLLVTYAKYPAIRIAHNTSHRDSPIIHRLNIEKLPLIAPTIP